jgi:hypothetical protein
MKSGDRVSGTQIVTGRKPLARRRLRCARTLSREVEDRSLRAFGARPGFDGMALILAVTGVANLGYM